MSRPECIECGIAADEDNHCPECGCEVEDNGYSEDMEYFGMEVTHPDEDDPREL